MKGVFAYIDPVELRARRFPKPALAQEHSPTSRAAAARIEPTRANLQTLVFLTVRGSLSGMTDEEIQHATGMNPSTERPRRIELVEQGRIVDSGRTRRTRSGRAAVIWEAA